MRTERQIQLEILRAFGCRRDLRLWRQNTGRAIPIWALQKRIGETITMELISDLERIAFGIIGSADLSGILSDGRRLEIEAKAARGRQSGQQQNFQRMIERFNGAYILARSVDDVHRGLRGHGFPPAT